jgi:uncharacterized protein (UPF0332 family)
MFMDKDNIVALSKYRIEKAEQDLLAAKKLLKENLYKQSINRSYYAMFHITRALLSLKKLDSSKHSGIMSLFNQNFVATKIIEKEYFKMLVSAEKIRNKSDYDDFFIASKEQSNNQIFSAQKFLERLKKQINLIICNNKIK